MRKTPATPNSALVVVYNIIIALFLQLRKGMKSWIICLLFPPWSEQTQEFRSTRKGHTEMVVIRTILNSDIFCPYQ